MGKVQRLAHVSHKQELKRDEFRDFIEDATDWVRNHVENVVIGAVLVAVLGFGVYYFMNSRGEASLKASMQLSTADNLFQRALSSSDQQVFAQAAASYQAVKAEYDNLPEGQRAELGLANVDFQSGKFDDAKAGYERFVLDHGSSALAPVALAGEAASLEGLAKPAEAAQTYLSVPQKYPEAANIAQSLLDAARIFAGTGQKDQLKAAVDALEKLQNDGKLPDSLKARLAFLKAKAA